MFMGEFFNIFVDVGYWYGTITYNCIHLEFTMLVLGEDSSISVQGYILGIIGQKPSILKFR